MILENSNDHFGNDIEAVYKTLYDGGGTPFGSVVVHLLFLFDKLTEAGIITYGTRKKVEKILTNDVRLSKLKVISRNSSKIVLLNSETHEKDAFDLEDFIFWVTSTLCKDPILKRQLGGREDYEGVRQILNKCKKNISLPSPAWTDFYIHGDTVFFTCSEGFGFRLFARKMETFHFSRDDSRFNESLLREELLDGKIYSLDDGTVYVEDAENIIAVRYKGKGVCRKAKFEGTIIQQLEDGGFLYISNNKIFRMYRDGRREKLMEKPPFSLFDTEGEEFLWKGILREKDLPKEELATVREKREHYQRKEMASKKMLWKGLLFTLYDFKQTKFINKIGVRLRFAGAFDVIPQPFTIKEIGKRLSQIEGLCYEGDITKAEEYVEAMSSIMRLEKQNLDEQNTMMALSDLLDNVCTNPYETIANRNGMIMSSEDYICDRVVQLEELLGKNNQLNGRIS